MLRYDIPADWQVRIMEDNHPKIDEKFMEEAMQSFEKAWRSGELRELMRKYPRCKPEPFPKK